MNGKQVIEMVNEAAPHMTEAEIVAIIADPIGLSQRLGEPIDPRFAHMLELFGRALLEAHRERQPE